MINIEIEALKKIIKNSNSIEKGHFIIKNRYHTDIKINTMNIFNYPKYTKKIGKILYSKFKKLNVDYVMIPINKESFYGLTLANNVAERFNARLIWVWRENFLIKEPEIKMNCYNNILIIDDCINTGNSIKQLIALIQHDLLCECVGVGVFLNRYLGEMQDLKDYNFISLLDYKNSFKVYDKLKESCPLCDEYNDIETELITLNSIDENRKIELMKKKSRLEKKPLYE